MEMVLTFILFKIFPIFMCQEPNDAIVLLASTFRFNFKYFPIIGEVIIWQMTRDTKSFEPQIYYRCNIPKFESDKTYLLFSRCQKKRYRIYYWVGITASLVAKKVAAKYALVLYLQLKECIEVSAFMTISREEQFIESESFHNTIKFVEKEYVTEEMHNYHDTVDELLNSKLPNMYIVRGETTTRIKAVPMGTQWLINDACLILVTGFKVVELPPVNVLCGPNASDLASLRSEVLRVVWYSFYKNGSPSSFEYTLKAFVEVLENMDNHNAHDVDDSQDHLKDSDNFVADRDRSISFHRIYQKKMRRWRPKPNEHYLALNCDNGIYGSELFDSASIAGMFFYVHNWATEEEKQKGLEMAEEYLHNNYTLVSKQTRMRIKELQFSPYNYPDFEINLVRYPFIPGLRNDNEHW